MLKLLKNFFKIFKVSNVFIAWNGSLSVVCIQLVTVNYVISEQNYPYPYRSYQKSHNVMIQATVKYLVWLSFQSSDKSTWIGNLSIKSQSRVKKLKNFQYLRDAGLWFQNSRIWSVRSWKFLNQVMSACMFRYYSIYWMIVTFICYSNGDFVLLTRR